MPRDTPSTSELEELLRPHWPSPRSHCSVMWIGSGLPATLEDGEGLPDETLAETLSRFNGHKPPRRIIGWLAGFTVPGLRRRQQRREQRIQSSETLQPFLTQSDRSIERSELLESRLSRLASENQQAHRLSYLQKLTTAEMAAGDHDR